MTEWDRKLVDLICRINQLGLDLETDNFGQIVIYTGMKFDENDRIVPMEDEEE